MLTKDLVQAIAKTNSCLFTVVFKKANGELRTMYAKTGVKRFLSKNPNKRKYSKTKSNQNITVFDVEKKQYRSFNPENVIEFRCNKKILKLVD